jgi:putative ABC transport system ATP-binding protein
LKDRKVTEEHGESADFADGDLIGALSRRRAVWQEGIQSVLVTGSGQLPPREKGSATELANFPELVPPVAPENCIICAEGLWKIYDMGSEQQVQALRGVNVLIQRNEYVAIMGPSGSGKSTLINLIGCLDTPSHGNYWLNGQLVSKLEEKELARIRNEEFGFVFQAFNLLARATALHNVELPLIYAGVPAHERLERAKASLTSVGMESRMNHKPNELSGGQRQRVAIARALVSNPSIILADEPTGNLDAQTGVEIMVLFDRLHQQGNTIVLVTHEYDIAEYARRIIYIEDGQVLSDQNSARAW